MIKPTYLYIKQHAITGLKYFGKTTKSDPYKYLGSGKYWLRHIKKYGRNHVKTIWISEPFMDKDTLIEFATFISKELNIVESSQWANLQEENGIDGVISGSIPWNKDKTGLYQITDETKLKMSIAKLGKQRPLTIRDKISKSQSIVVIIDNIEYSSFTNAAKILNVSKSTIHRWVKAGKAVLKE